MSPSIRLIHWNTNEGKRRAQRLESAGFRVSTDLPKGGRLSAFLQGIADESPDAVVIDLSHLPSQGRDIGIAIRHRKSTRSLPLVFVGGDPKKVDRIKELLPDATYAAWEGIKPSVLKAIKRPPADPVVPGSFFAAYASTPLVRKLGIRADWTVALADAPADFPQTLGELPAGVKILEAPTADSDLTIWFTRSEADLAGGIQAMAARASRGPLWIAWPKKASGMGSDLSQQAVRKVGLTSGLVDYKICSIDRTWSALLFTRRES